MKVTDLIDAALPAPHGNRQGLSYGQLTVLWLTYILTQYDHRMNPVESWVHERQQTLQLATLDPVGVPLVTATLPGQQADDPTYLPIWQRMVQTLGRPDFLLVADCKLGRLSNRAQIQAHGGFYLCPLAMVGSRDELLRDWVLEPPAEIQDLVFDGVKWGRGFEITLGLWSDEALPNREAKLRGCWEERALVIKSETLAERQDAGLQARLQASNRAREIGAIAWNDTGEIGSQSATAFE